DVFARRIHGAVAVEEAPGELDGDGPVAAAPPTVRHQDRSTGPRPVVPEDAARERRQAGRDVDGIEPDGPAAVAEGRVAAEGHPAERRRAGRGAAPFDGHGP